MSILNKYNEKTNVSKFNTTINNDVYKTLEEVYNGDYDQSDLTVYSLFTHNKSKYGESAVAVCKEFNVNLPNHLVDVVKDMISDNEVIELVNKHQVALKPYQYQSKHYGVGYSTEFIEREAF